MYGLPGFFPPALSESLSYADGTGNRQVRSEAVRDQSVGGVMGRDADLYAVSHHDLDPVFFHAAGEDGPQGARARYSVYHMGDPCSVRRED
jgi:hypothetical protein